jgi:hypothetical protein
MNHQMHSGGTICHSNNQKLIINVELGLDRLVITLAGIVMVRHNFSMWLKLNQSCENQHN